MKKDILALLGKEDGTSLKEKKKEGKQAERSIKKTEIVLEWIKQLSIKESRNRKKAKSKKNLIQVKDLHSSRLRGSLTLHSFTKKILSFLSLRKITH